MSFDPRSLFPGDEEDAQLFPRLPPISSGAPLRPAPLEPSAQKDEENLPGVRLSNAESRSQNQAASAIPKDAQPLPAYINPADLRNGPRNRDFLQLPALPTTSATGSTTPASRLTIPVLNDLHQPPPSAALFPRITENESKRHAKKLPSPSESPLESACTQDTTAVDSDLSAIKLSKKKRSRSGSLRSHAGTWDAAEKAALIEGVLKHGTSNWKAILADDELHFQPKRTYLELKEMYRICETKHNEQRLKLQSTAKPKGTSTKDSTRAQVEPAPKAPLCEKDRTKNADHKKTKGSLGLQFEVSTVKDFETREILRDKSDYTRIPRFARWTPDEDSRLDTGFRKHGFSWSAISSDATIGLTHRSAAQIRDRFRIRYPANYKDNSATIPATKPAKESSNDDTREHVSAARDEAASAPIRALLTSDDQNLNDKNTNDTPDEQGVALPPLDKTLLQTARAQIASSSVNPTNSKKPDRPANGTNEVSSWLNQLEDSSMDVEDDTTQDLIVDEDLGPGSQLAPLRFLYDQDWVDASFDSSLQLAPMMSFYQDAEDPQ